MKSWFSSKARARAATWLKRQWREWRLFIFGFCFVWVPLRSAVIDYSPVPTGSMNPTILEGDVLWIDKLAYDLRVPLTRIHLATWANPKHGDIVVVLSPLDGTRLVKRVIGVPGDTIALVNNRLMLNGHAVEYRESTTNYGATIAHKLQPYAFFAEENLAGVSHPVMGLQVSRGVQRNFGPVVVPEDRYFLMGDSRDNSRDSREIGFASRDAILGQAKGVLVSLDINDSYRLRTERFFSPLR